MFCSRCGTEYLNGEHYCQKCGNRLDVANNQINQNSIPINSGNMHYTVVQRNQLNYGLIGLISAIVILPISLIIRFGFAKTVVRYGWREYTTSVLPDGMKVVGVILILALLAVSVACMVTYKKKNQNTRNKFQIPTVIINIIATILSFMFIFG